MAHLPESSRLWLERADIDYIGPFVKAWAAFNAWYRQASGTRRDADGLRYVKESANPVRGRIKPLLKARELDEQGNSRADSEDALQFKRLVRNLYVSLENYHIEVMREDVVERISFRTVCLSNGVNLPKQLEYRRHEYVIQKQHGRWISAVRRRDGGVEVGHIEQSTFDPISLQADPAYQALTPEQRGQLLGLYNQCNPRPFTDLLVGVNDPIIAGDITFRCTDDQLFTGLIDVLYALRNALLHGELQPNEQALQAYEEAYRIVLRLLRALQV